MTSDDHGRHTTTRRDTLNRNAGIELHHLHVRIQFAGTSGNS